MVQPKQPTLPVSAPTVESERTNNQILCASKVTQALSIIAEESGLAFKDLTNETNFSDVGIDSLLAMAVSTRLKDELDIDLDFNELFFESPTVGDFKIFLGESKAGPSGSISDSSSRETTSPLPSSTAATTPLTEVETLACGVDFQNAIKIISEESGFSAEELTDDTNFVDSGVDSLLSLTIVGRLRDELDLDIQHESLFTDFPTVGELKRSIIGDTSDVRNAESPAALPSKEHSKNMTNGTKLQLAEQDNDLAIRQNAVDHYIKRYTSDFSSPVLPSLSTTSNDTSKTILLTGASGSLGGHLASQIAQIPDVKTVICLNRKKSMDAYLYQQKTMESRGIHTFDSIRSKLLVLESDSSKPRFGLSDSQYSSLLESVTHIIHNGWPMSVKRPLTGFESQFQVMRNLIDFSRDVASRRRNGFKFRFLFVSSVSVVGKHGLSEGKDRVDVPEERHGLKSVMPCGYGDAKWGCERMLDETLHKYPEHFSPMVVRLGQIAGSRASGYWNPTEHFAFLIKSSQTLNALPDTGGNVYWTPVDDIAGTLADLALLDHQAHAVYHVENPIGQSWAEMNAHLADALKIPNLVPFPEWILRVRTASHRDNPAALLLDFLDSNYLRMSCGGLVLSVSKTLEHSKTLSSVGPVSKEVVEKYIRVWREIGFLDRDSA